MHGVTLFLVALFVLLLCHVLRKSELVSAVLSCSVE